LIHLYYFLQQQFRGRTAAQIKAHSPHRRHESLPAFIAIMRTALLSDPTGDLP
jgi:hypothetical protein